MSIDLICRQLRAARLAARRSQQSIAGEVGVVQSSVSDWETGIVNPTLSSLRSWARALDHTVVLLPMSSPDSTSPESGLEWAVQTGGPFDPFPYVSEEVARANAHGRRVLCRPAGTFEWLPAESTKDGDPT